MDSGQVIGRKGAFGDAEAFAQAGKEFDLNHGGIAGLGYMCGYVYNSAEAARPVFAPLGHPCSRPVAQERRSNLICAAPKSDSKTLTYGVYAALFRRILICPYQ